MLEINMQWSVVTVTYFLFTNVSLLTFQCLKSIYLSNNFKRLISKTTGVSVLKFQMEHDLAAGSQHCKIRFGQDSKMAAVTKNR